MPKGSPYRINENNLYNIGLLPKSSNASKGNKVLIELLSNEVLVDNVVKYEEIPQDKFSEFQKSSHLDSLKTFRGPLFKKVFTDKRNEWIN